VQPEDDAYRVMVPLANPEHEHELITLASAIANQRGGAVDAVHIVTVPDQTPLAVARDDPERFEANPYVLTEQARQDAETFGVPVDTHTIFSHRGFEEVFDAARTHDADLLVMGRGPHGAPGRAESALDELTADLPCDVVVFQNRGFDPEHVVLPTAGGPDSELGADLAGLLQAEFGSRITILHVADDAEAGRGFVEQWAADHGLDDAECRVEAGDVEAAIERVARDATLMVLGATERGLLERLVSGSVVHDVAEAVDCSVILAERAGPRSIWQRILGR